MIKSLTGKRWPMCCWWGVVYSRNCSCHPTSPIESSFDFLPLFSVAHPVYIAILRSFQTSCIWRVVTARMHSQPWWTTARRRRVERSFPTFSRSPLPPTMHSHWWRPRVYQFATGRLFACWWTTAVMWTPYITHSPLTHPPHTQSHPPRSLFASGSHREIRMEPAYVSG